MPDPTAQAVPLAVIPDSNVLIHGRSLHELPWRDLGADEIEILIVGPVLREIDALKLRPGRPGRLARNVSSQLRTLLTESDAGDVVVASHPRVTRHLWLGDEARTPVRAGIDLGHGDLAIINRALWLMDTGRDVLLLTDDTLAAAHAKEFGLPYRLLDDAWLRPSEKDEAQKEVARLKDEISRMRMAGPALRGWFVDVDGKPIDRIDATLGRHLPLDPATVDVLMARVIAANPMAAPPPPAPERTPPPQLIVDIAALDAEMDRHFSPILARAQGKYREDHAAWIERVRRQLTDLHATWNRRRNWPEITLKAMNEGSRPAETALVELLARGDFTLTRPRRWRGEAGRIDEGRKTSEMSIPMPPAPPRRETAASLLLGHGHEHLARALGPALDPLSALSRTRDPDAFYWRTARDEPMQAVELDCANWRHARGPEDFRLVIGGRDDAPIRGLVTGRLSAANVATPLEVRLPVRIAFEDRPMEAIAETMAAEFERVSAAWRRAQRLPDVPGGDVGP